MLRALNNSAGAPVSDAICLIMFSVSVIIYLRSCSFKLQHSYFSIGIAELAIARDVHEVRLRHMDAMILCKEALASKYMHSRLE